MDIDSYKVMKEFLKRQIKIHLPKSSQTELMKKDFQANHHKNKMD